jgi:peptide/nickel transport system substrate-binding protein
MKNKKTVWIAVIMIGTLLLAACGSSETPTQDTSGGGGSSATEPAATQSSGGGNNTASGADLALDPANASGDNALALVGYLYEGLVKVSDGEVVPALAVSYTVSEDGLDYIFNLRPGVTFHDGSALNADVVVLNFNRWFNPNDPNRGSGDFAAWVENFGGFFGEFTEDNKPKSVYDGIEKVDELTVLVHLNTVDPDFLTKLANPAFSIVSANAFANGDGGTGAYQVESNDGTNVTLAPFAGYWDAAMLPSESMTVPAP